MRILIAGAGIGGLATAWRLHHEGIERSVLLRPRSGSLCWGCCRQGWAVDCAAEGALVGACGEGGFGEGGGQPVDAGLPAVRGGRGDGGFDDADPGLADE